MAHRAFCLQLSCALFVAASALGCGGAAAPTAPPPAARPVPAGTDVTQPTPIDHRAGTPATYKGLPLRLTDNGEPVVTAVDGVIGLVCIGMSNANQECATFVERVRGAWAGAVNPQVRVANCAVGGNAIERWNDPSQDTRLWGTCIGSRLGPAGIRADQVRVIYHKAANQFTTGPGGSALPLYPGPGSDYENFLANLRVIADRVPEKFPSVQAVYTTSRSYGGFSTQQASRGEPLSYEEGHALNTWLRDNATVRGVWQGWGPYIWAPDCATGTNGTGMCYARGDYVDDGVHPSPSGREKIALAIHERFRRDAWYRP